MIRLIHPICKSQDIESIDQCLIVEITTDGALVYKCFFTFFFPYEKTIRQFII